MLWKLSVLAIVLVGVVSCTNSRTWKSHRNTDKSRGPMVKAINRAKIQNFQKRAQMNRVKSFLKRFCEKEEYQTSTVCSTFFKCKCGNGEEGLFKCFAQECNEDKSFFCDSMKCQTGVESNETEDDCTLATCDRYLGLTPWSKPNKTLDPSEAAICTKIRFWKTMKECRAKQKPGKNIRSICINQICSDGSMFKKECNKKLFWKNMSECYKNFTGPQYSKEREECQQQLCKSKDSNQKSCQQIAFWKNVRECRKENWSGRKSCLSNLCEDKGCKNAFCKYFNRRNQNVKCIDPCA